MAILRCRTGDAAEFVAPRLASFAEALALIEAERARAARIFVAIDQPTLVPNATGSRPVDNVAASVVSWLGGGVQPANRSKRGMFDDAAPIWRFKAALAASDDPEAARAAKAGMFLAEVFPALALPSLAAEFCGRKLAPRYNPARKHTFRLEHWHAVVDAVAATGEGLGIGALAAWCRSLPDIPPRKADQDRLDAVICALIGYIWLFEARERSVILGDTVRGFMIVPVVAEIRARLETAASLRGVGCR